ncbi:MAG: FGGY-family carbohydrate kinase [Oceanospirillaceae bacterium]|nr:FGGY-family carbohydrate kinase [Oceanospirillaceae bacterium]
MSNYLVVNLGLKSIRVIVFDENGKQIYVDARPVFSKLRGEKVEQDGNEWKMLLHELMHELNSRTTLATTISHITATTSSSCILGVDEQGSPVSPVMMVSDKRSKTEVEDILDSIEFKDGAVKYQYKCSTSSTIPKVLWYKRNEREVYNKVFKWIGAGEFIHHFFTGEYVTDALNAGKAFYNGHEYDPDLFARYELKGEAFPSVVDIGTEIELDNQVTSEYNLPRDCKLVVTTYDAICAVIGAYDGSNNTACDVSGTVTSVRVLTPKTVKNHISPILLSQELGLENLRLIGASNNLGGGIIEWCKQALFDENNKYVYYDMENSASNSTVGASGIVFLPYLLGERAPFKSDNAKGSFFGISRHSSKDDLTRAVFESTAFVTNDLMNLIVDAGIELGSLSVSGGLARFDLINQIKADVTNKDVKVLENFESTSVGAFVLLGLSIGKYETLLEACQSIVKIRKIISPSQSSHEVYESFFNLYKSINEALADSYIAHADALKSIESLSSITIKNL